MIGAALFVGLGLGFWQQASGSEAAVYYSPHVLEVGGPPDKEWEVFCVCVCVSVSSDV